MRLRTHIAPPKVSPRRHGDALIGYVWILTIAVISCNVSTLLPLSPAVPTTVLETMTPPSVPPEATPTQTALPVSPTPLLTDTPSLTPTSASTVSPSDELSCKLLSQSIKNGSHFSPREDFEMGWKVRNNGTSAWDPGSVDFAYFSGTRMYQFSPAHLQTSVDHGDTVALGASLVAPKNSGTYTTVWALRRGNYDFCHVSIRIIVP